MRKKIIIKLIFSFFILMLLISINHKIINTNIFNKFYTIDTMQIERGIKYDVNSYIYYKNGEYEKSSIRLSEIIKDDSCNMTALYYLALCYIEMDKKNESIDLFNKIINDNNNLYVEKSTWYLGLCYVDIKNYDKASKQFEKLLSGENIEYKEKSKKILNKISKL